MTAHDLRRVAVVATADPRTITAYLKGKPVTPMARVRIEGALRRLGFYSLIQGSASAGMNASELAPTGGMRL